MSAPIKKVAVVGAGTMGAGIAGLCASVGCDVVLIDVQKENAQKGIERLCAGKRPVITSEQAAKITAGSLDSDLSLIADCDWICEAVVENLQIKRNLFSQLEGVRKDGSIITTNTSGIPLRDIYQQMPERLQRDIAVTHFFNPVHIMKLVELVPGSNTDPDVTRRLADFFDGPMAKGTVYAKDTVNFIANRIGCFWMLAGLHKAGAADINIEIADALMSKPVGLPPTGLYGLIDLIGLDIMDSVAKNLQQNLPASDLGRDYLTMPDAELTMLANKQLGRKTGGGFYKMLKAEDGSKSMEVFDLGTETWRTAETVTLEEVHTDIKTLMFSNDAEGTFAWDLMSATLLYSSSLVPEISNDIVNIDRAMKWGFNWAQGPFELIDTIGAEKFAQKVSTSGGTLDGMLKILLDSNHETFYTAEGSQYLSLQGKYEPISAI